MKHVHSLKNKVYVVSGQVKGKTLLPLPVGAERAEAATNLADNKGLVHAIESVIIERTHQIRDVLKKDSAQPLLEGLHPTPHVEIQFWKAKGQNIECNYDQLKDPKVVALAQLLGRSNSSYYSSFSSIMCDFVADVRSDNDDSDEDYVPDSSTAQSDDSYEIPVVLKKKAILQFKALHPGIEYQWETIRTKVFNEQLAFRKKKKRCLELFH